MRPTPENAARVYDALSAFGAPLADLEPVDLATPSVIFQIGVAPNRIDILTSIHGVEFGDAWPRRVVSSYGGIPIALMSAQDLIRNKRAAGRPQDLIDVDKLEAALRDSAPTPEE